MSFRLVAGAAVSLGSLDHIMQACMRAAPATRSLQVLTFPRFMVTVSDSCRSTTTSV